MAALAFRADIKLATATLEAIDKALERSAEDGLRPHLGASLIGRPCARALWYSFRWATRTRHEARILRLFARGHREEGPLSDMLRAAGITVIQVDPNTGRQFTFGDCHFGGSMDGACVGVPDAPKTWHALEYKTHGAKSFAALAAKGVKEAKPEHWAQMQCYMHWSGMTRALYVAVCKDDDRLHIERVDVDKEAGQQLIERAATIVNSATPVEGVSTDPSWYECKFCDHREICHGTAAPLPTCRSCAHSTPEPGGVWTCSHHGGRRVDVLEQKVGCAGHRVIPILLKNWAEPIDASESDNLVKYRLKDGGEFVNGEPVDGFTSEELYALHDKAMLADEQMLALRARWDGRIAA